MINPLNVSQKCPEQVQGTTESCLLPFKESSLFSYVACQGPNLYKYDTTVC